MAVFKGHKVGANELLQLIPEALLSELAQKTQVDYYSKVLHGRKLFYLLMYSVLENDRLSQRTLEDTFNDPFFKRLFNLNEDETVRRSSISDRLGGINPYYFQQVYNFMYDLFSQYYDEKERHSLHLIRVDSTMVADTTGRIIDGFTNENGKRHTKYSVTFDGLLPSSIDVFTKDQYQSEDIALPEAIFNHALKEPGHSNIYIIDRGLQSVRTMAKFNREHIPFVVRLKENRKHIVKQELTHDTKDLDLGESILEKDSLVQLYTGMPVLNKRGNKHYREELLEEEFRLIIVRSKREGKAYWFLTNDLEKSPKEIAQAYRRRWDIEVFFRFIKQELNASLLVSLNSNGMQVMLYMTMIVAMLLLVYKRANSVGYKTAKRRFKMEIRDLIIAMIIIDAGGDPNIYFKT